MSPDRIAETGEISDLNLALRESSKYPKKSTACQERCFSHVKEEIPPAGEIEAFASLSRKAAGSQGSALSRIPQDAESPLETRGSARVSTNSRSAGEIEAFASLSRKAAGSQGSALSRIPQDAESPLETRGSARVSTNSRFKRRPQAARLFCAQSALIRPDPLDRVFFIVFLLPSTHFIRARHGSISALDNP